MRIIPGILHETPFYTITSTAHSASINQAIDAMRTGATAGRVLINL